MPPKADSLQTQSITPLLVHLPICATILTLHMGAESTLWIMRIVLERLFPVLLSISLFSLSRMVVGGKGTYESPGGMRPALAADPWFVGEETGTVRAHFDVFGGIFGRFVDLFAGVWKM